MEKSILNSREDEIMKECVFIELCTVNLIKTKDRLKEFHIFHID